ncbi:hypothetical protein KVR01_011443 [Diaporthe batatas]|uniref:uncharacterized protein n=1 Tax=Diaporthe batatas TaxID=748121 RepID=UPI001D038CC3|nr:uncharacterized protein KVR01_011443 [Diaporthe batatas]KAG8159000.1 hypothetical protein KVR01_011443 [Diaporthe batatas]
MTQVPNSKAAGFGDVVEFDARNDSVQDHGPTSSALTFILRVDGYFLYADLCQGDVSEVAWVSAQKATRETIVRVVGTVSDHVQDMENNHDGLNKAITVTEFTVLA